MKIHKIKAEMFKYRDLYGGDLFKTDEIERASTKEELQKILNDHEGFLKDQLQDAIGHLDDFKKRVGLFMI